MADRIGQQFGNYRLISLLGQGGFAEVYLGEHVYLGTRAAIKVLHTRLTNEDLESFRNEARTIAHLVHPNIVRILEFGVEASVPFLVMDYAPNGSLRQRHPRGTSLSINSILPYVMQIAAGLQYAHNQKLIHRDIKPENMLLGRNNEAMLSDFGIAMIAQSSRLQSIQEVVGTVSYMAPEQFHGKPRLASDQYALGIVVYEWLCGDRPFHGSFTEIASQHMFVLPPPLREKGRTILPYVEEVVLRALAKDPKQRFASIQDFANALEQASLSTFVRPPVPSLPLPSERNFPPVDAPASPLIANTTPPPERVSTSLSTSPPLASPPVSTTSYKEVPNRIYRQQPATQSDRFVGLTQVTQAKKWPNFALIIGISLLLVVLVGSGIFYFTRSPGKNIGNFGANSGGSPGSLGALKVGLGVDLNNKTITLGILSPYSGPVADLIGIPLANGVKAYFDHVNDNGGIDGFTVKFLEEDTQYNSQIVVQKYTQIRNQILMIADSLGTSTTLAINPLATADHMLVSAATLSSSLAREKYLILPGTPYRLQAENAFDYIVNKLGVTNPATGIIYQNDEYGQDGLTGYKEAIAAYHLNDVGQASYAVTDTNFTVQVSQLKAAGAKYVFLTTTPSATASIMGTAFQLGYNPQWILQSPAFSLALLSVPALKPLMDRTWVVSQGVAWGDTSVPGMAQLLQDVAKYFPNQKPDGYFEFGYTESEITYAILKKALDNNDITRDGLFNAFESLKTVDLGGLYPPVTYGSSPNERVPTRDSVVYQIDPTQPAGVKPLTADFTGSAAMQSQF